MHRNLPAEEVRFAKNVSIMGHAISAGINKLNNEGYKVIDPITVLVAISVIENHDPHDLIHQFIIKSHEECWDKIKERDETYFIQNISKILNMGNNESINIFKDLFTTVDKNGVNVLSKKLKDEIWDLFDAMIKIAIKYIHKQNKQSEKYKHVDLDKHCKVWKITV